MGIGGGAGGGSGVDGDALESLVEDTGGGVSPEAEITADGSYNKSFYGYDQYSINHPIFSIRYFGGPANDVRESGDLGYDSARRDLVLGSMMMDVAKPLTPATTGLVKMLGSEIMYESGTYGDSYFNDPVGSWLDWTPRDLDDYFGMRAEGKTIRRTVRAAIIGLPTTDIRGFLDINSKFIHRIQIKYDKSDDQGDTFSSGRLPARVVQFNRNFGFDGDQDGREFESFFEAEYPYLPWATFSTKFRTIARLDRNSYNVEFFHGTNPYGTSDSFFSNSVFMEDGEIRYGATTGKFNAVNPAIEQPLYALFSTMSYDGSWYEDPSLTTSQYTTINEDLPNRQEGGDAINKFYTGGSPFGGSFIDESAHFLDFSGGFIPEGAGMTIILHNVWHQKYSYNESTYPEIKQDLLNRYKTLEYVRKFSNELISDRTFRIAESLSTSVARAADIKIQQNQPISSRLLSAVGQDYNIEEGMIPDTTIEGAEVLRGRSMEEAIMTGLFGTDPGVY